MAVSKLSKSFNQALSNGGTLGASELLDAAQFDENIQNNPKLRQQVNRLRETVGIEETKNTLAESTKQADQIFTDFDDETTAKNYINTNFDTKQAPIVNAIITRKFDEKRSADKGADANTWRAIDLVYQGNPDELFKFIELGKTKQSRDAMLRYTVDRISGKKLASNPKLYATLLAKTPDQTKKMDLNIFRSNLSEDEFKNLTQLYDQNDSAPDAIKTPFVFAVENYPFVGRNVAGLGFTNDDGETIDLGRVQKSEFIINANKQLQRQQQQNPDQPLTNSEIDRTLKNVELSTQASNGPGITDNALNKILKSGNVIVNTVDDRQRSPDVSIDSALNSVDGGESLSISLPNIFSRKNPAQINLGGKGSLSKINNTRDETSSVQYNKIPQDGVIGINNFNKNSGNGNNENNGLLRKVSADIFGPHRSPVNNSVSKTKGPIQPFRKFDKRRKSISDASGNASQSETTSIGVTAGFPSIPIGINLSKSITIDPRAVTRGDTGEIIDYGIPRIEQKLGHELIPIQKDVFAYAINGQYKVGNNDEIDGSNLQNEKYSKSNPIYIGKNINPVIYEAIREGLAVNGVPSKEINVREALGWIAKEKNKTKAFQKYVTFNGTRASAKNNNSKLFPNTKTIGLNVGNQKIINFIMPNDLGTQRVEMELPPRKK